MAVVFSIFICFMLSGCKKSSVTTEESQKAVNTKCNEEVIIKPEKQKNLFINKKTTEKGKVSINEDAEGNLSIIYTPNENVFGTDEFNYESKENSTKYKVKVIVNITEPDPLIAKNDIISCREDTSLKIESIIDNDTSGAAGVLEFVDFTNVKNGIIKKVDGEYFFIPEKEFNGEGSFTYTVKDSMDRTAATSAIVSISPETDLPEANEDKVEAFNDEVIMIDPLENDIDADGDKLYIESVNNYEDQENLGSIEIKDNKLYYTPDYKKTGVDRFTYTIKDSSEDELKATGVITIGVISRDGITEKTIETKEEQGIEIPVQGQVLEIMDDVENGDLKVNNLQDEYNDIFYYSPDENFNGEDSFSLYYKNISNERTVHMKVKIIVDSVNDAPKAIEDQGIVEEDSVCNIIDVINNDIELDGDKLVIESIEESEHGIVKIENNKIVYTPNKNFNGQDNISYTVNDGHGETAVAKVNITVNSVNDVPTAVNDQFVVDEDSGDCSFDVLKNDKDIDGDNLTIERIEDRNGKARVEGNKVVYDSNGEFNGQDSINYTINDGNGETSTATINVTVNSKNDNPILKSEHYKIYEDTGIHRFDVLSNASDEELDELILEEIHSDADYEILRIVDNQIEVKAKENYNESYDEIYYTVSDGNGGKASSYVYLSVENTFDPPVAVDDEFKVGEDGEHHYYDILSNDYSVDGSDSFLSIIEVGNPINGTAYIPENPNTNSPYICYIPNEGFAGEEIIEYKIEDLGGATATAKVYITVVGPNNEPKAENDVFVVAEDSVAITLDVLANDTDADGNELTISNVEYRGWSSWIPKNASIYIEDNKIVYTPRKDFYGHDTLYYSISDGLGAYSSGKINITVENVNDAPIANDDEFTVWEDTKNTPSNTLRVLPNDIDVDDDNITIESIGQGQNGIATIEYDQIVYNPNLDFYGQDIITYTIKDRNGETATARVTINVVSINDNPIVNDEQYEVDEDSSDNKFDVLSNDSDIEGDSITIKSISNPKNGTATMSYNTNGDKIILYTPNVNFNGTEYMSYTVEDANEGTSIGLITITVNPSNDAPVAEADQYVVDEDSLDNEFDVLDNDTDVDEDKLTIKSVGTSENSTISIVDKKIIYTPNTSFNGQDTITYTISDGNGETSKATINITVNPANHVPVAVDDEFYVEEYSFNNLLDVLANDTDADGDILTISSVDAPYYKVEVVNNKIQYSPESIYVGEIDSFTYTIIDSSGQLATATVKIIVTSMSNQQ
ncbi:MAG: Ig-like domain-containing protein [Clostridiaceae bacterium]